MAKTDSSKKKKSESTPEGGDIHVGGNVTGDHIVVGSNNVIHYHATDGEKREMKTGWFYGHRYGDLDTFTGRAAELEMLNAWLNNDKDNLLMLRALGGFGKSALTWTWFNRVDHEHWQTAVWWSFYEKESGFENFLSETLTHLGIDIENRKPRLQVNDLLEAIHETKILIVLDGFERLLRQYSERDMTLQNDDVEAHAVLDQSQRDCTSHLTETFLLGLSGTGIRSKVLMTTRLTPRILESADGKLFKGCREEPLAAFSPEDAIAYFHKEGIVATARTEITSVCSVYGYHPLSLSLLVGLINEDHEQRGDIIAAKKLDVFGDIKAKRSHVLKRVYESLSPERRDLLSKISCFSGSMEYAVLKKVFLSPDLDKALLDLRKRGLLQYVGETQHYDMHPIVRRYAYEHFTDEKLRKETHVKLTRHFIDSMSVVGTEVKKLEDLVSVIELYHHMIKAGDLDNAWKVFYDRINTPTYYQFGAYQLRIELLRALFLDGEDNPPRLKNESDQAWTLNALANSYALSGQPHRAVPLYDGYISISEKMHDKTNIVIGLGNAATQQLVIGALKGAERNLKHKIDLSQKNKIRDELFYKAIGHQALGRVLSYRGAWQEAEQELLKSQKIFDKMGTSETNLGSVNWAYRSLHCLLLDRTGNPEHINLSIEFAKIALKLAEEHTIKHAPYPRDYVRVHWLLGSAYRANNELTLAEENLSKALNLCRQINLLEMEADILLDVARLRYAQGDFKDAQEKASEALVITERSGYVLQGADVNLFLAQYALEQEKDKAKAKVYAEEAKKLATCDGPPYYYKVAYEEAEALLEKL